MKKICWILSINVNGVYSFSSPGEPIRPRVAFYSKEFQKELKTAFIPNYQIEFVSYDVINNRSFKADVFIYNERDAIHLTDEIKNKGIQISYQLFYKGEVEELKSFIESKLQ